MRLNKTNLLYLILLGLGWSILGGIYHLPTLLNIFVGLITGFMFPIFTTNDTNSRK